MKKDIFPVETQKVAFLQCDNPARRKVLRLYRGIIQQDARYCVSTTVLIYLGMYYIRPATSADAAIIRDLAEITWQQVYAPILSAEQLSYMLAEIYSEEKLSYQIKNNIQTYLLLVEDEQPVAFAAFSPREEDADVYKLHKLYCLPVTQGKGYGKILLNGVINEVLKAGKHVLDLNVNRYNSAKSFYEKMGFKVIYEEDVPIGKYFMNDFVMQKEF